MNVKMIYIMLGDSCNMNCKYCIQHDMKTEQFSKIDKEVYQYIDNLINDKYKINLRFFGGEPLLYWDNIVQLTNYFKDKNVYLSMITNGSLLDEEKVKFINDNKILTLLSYDGENTIQTRGYDVVKDKYDLILKIDNLSFATVITKHNYPLDFLNHIQKIDNEYAQIHKYHLYSNVELIMEDETYHCKDMYDFDLDKLNKQSEGIAKIYYDCYSGKNNAIDNQQIIFYVNYILQHITEAIDFEIPFCVQRYGIINIDKHGNMYRCHNCSEIVGTIKDDLETILQRIYDKAETKTNAKTCDKCSVQLICENGCQRMCKEIRDSYWCKCQHALYDSIMELSYKLSPEFLELLNKKSNLKRGN